MARAVEPCCPSATKAPSLHGSDTGAARSNETMEVEEGENSITAAVTPQPSVEEPALEGVFTFVDGCLLYTSPSPRD